MNIGVILKKKKIQVSTLKSLNKVRLIQSSNTFLLVYKNGDVKMFNLISVEFCEALEHWKYQWKLCVSRGSDWGEWLRRKIILFHIFLQLHWCLDNILGGWWLFIGSIIVQWTKKKVFMSFIDCNKSFND